MLRIELFHLFRLITGIRQELKPSVQAAVKQVSVITYKWRLRFRITHAFLNHFNYIYSLYAITQHRDTHTHAFQRRHTHKHTPFSIETQTQTHAPFNIETHTNTRLST